MSQRATPPVRKNASVPPEQLRGAPRKIQNAERKYMSKIYGA
jgi:hypothetical protein